MTNLYKITFFSLLLTSTIISISSMSWLTAWIGLEMNLMSLMPLMKTHTNKYMTEATIKYFIIQAMASAMLLFSIIMFSNYMKMTPNMPINASTLINSSLLLKLGAAPFHFWLPEVVSGLNWNMTFIMLTWQKIAPMMLLSYSMYSPQFFSLIVITSSLISGLQGLNQTCLRKMLAYSSINHMSWMISTLLMTMSLWTYYFTIYTIINLNIILILNKYKIHQLNQLTKMFNSNKKIKSLFMLNFLSLGGLPPFLGFFPKWMTINFMIKFNYYMLSLFLIIFTLISLYYYIRISFSSFSLGSEKSITKIVTKMSYTHFFTNLICLMSFSICLILTNFM